MVLGEYLVVQIFIFQIELIFIICFDTHSYDIGAGAIEFIICHAEVSIAFAEEKKIPEVLLQNTPFYSSLIVRKNLRAVYILL